MGEHRVRNAHPMRTITPKAAGGRRERFLATRIDRRFVVISELFDLHHANEF